MQPYMDELSAGQGKGASESCGGLLGESGGRHNFGALATAAEDVILALGGRHPRRRIAMASAIFGDQLRNAK